MNTQFKDLAIAAEAPSIEVMVRIYYRGYRMGFYRIAEERQDGLILAHGPVAFPIGCQIEVERRDNTSVSQQRISACILSTGILGMKLRFRSTHDG